MTRKESFLELNRDRGDRGIHLLVRLYRWD